MIGGKIEPCISMGPAASSAAQKIEKMAPHSAASKSIESL